VADRLLRKVASLPRSTPADGELMKEEFARDLLLRLAASVALSVGQTLSMDDMVTSVSDAANQGLRGRSR